MEYKGKRIVITGGTGMIGRSIIDLLIKRGANNIYVVSIDNPPNDLPKGVGFLNLDLTKFDNCMTVCDGADYIIHMAGIKGSPKMCKEKPASFFVPTILFNTNMMEASIRCKVKRFLYASSVGVYHPAPILREENVWKTFPSENDRFAGWAKRMGELQIEAYKIQYGSHIFRTVRPTNIYGPYDNFDPENGLVIPSIIARVEAGESPLKVWGNGSQVRDFVFTDDCAEGSLKVFESDYEEPVNIGSGIGITIKELIHYIIKYSDYKPEIVWDTSKPSGDNTRVMDTTIAKSIDFSTTTSIEEGIKKTVNWYKKNKEKTSERYNVFTK
jgi:GDP-L-fucose synthase